MASLIEGMFSDSDAFKQKRLSDLQEQSERRKQMSLLNQVAAGRGAQIAEGMAGMFGLKTAEERKAEQLNKMSQNFDLKTSEGLAAFAKALNDAGMTKEAVSVLKERERVVDRTRKIAREDLTAERETEDRAIEKAMREGKIRKGAPRIELRVRTDSKGKPLMGPNGQPLMERVEIPTYERWSEKEQRYIPIGKQSSGTSSTSGLKVVDGWDNMLISTSSSGKPDMATNMPARGTGAHALKNKDAKTQGAMVQAYANYLRSLPAGAVPMEMDAWFKSQQ